MSLVFGIMVALPLATIIGGGISAIRIVTGKRDLVINDDSKQLQLPNGKIVPFVALAEIRIEDAKGFEINGRTVRNVHIYYAVNNATIHYKVCWTSDPEQARQLATYLALRLGISGYDGQQPLQSSDSPPATPQLS